MLQVTGKGFEDVADIGRDVAKLDFMGIDNIHAVRDSLASFSSACHTPGQEFFQAVGTSGWLRHLSQVRALVLLQCGLGRPGLRRHRPLLSLSGWFSVLLAKAPVMDSRDVVRSLRARIAWMNLSA